MCTYILMAYTQEKEHRYHGGTERQLAWRREFGQAARACSARTKGLPKGERGKAYRLCLRETLRKR